MVATAWASTRAFTSRSSGVRSSPRRSSRTRPHRHSLHREVHALRQVPPHLSSFARRSGVPEAHAEAWTRAVEGLLLAYADATEALTGAARKLYPDASDRARGGGPRSDPTILRRCHHGARSDLQRARAGAPHPAHGRTPPSKRGTSRRLSRAGEVIVPTLRAHRPGDHDRRRAGVRAVGRQRLARRIALPFDFAPAVDRASVARRAGRPSTGSSPRPRRPPLAPGRCPGRGRYPRGGRSRPAPGDEVAGGRTSRGP